MEESRHAVFILAAYGATALAMLALLIRAVVDHRAQVRALGRLEGAKVRRETGRD